jgi:hypothetical protein
MRTVIHVLSVHGSTSGVCDVTATVREGELPPGASVWFAGPDGARREVRVLSRRDGRRHLRLDLEGAEDLKPGAYLYAE